MTSENKRKMMYYISLIENSLSEYNCISDDIKAQNSIIGAMNYSLEAGGKRIRPLLVLEFCRLCGGDIKNAIAPACALEMIHTFSLIHDDLPAMDNDDFRRGKPSCHKQYDEAMAILAGDALNTRAFEIIAEDGNLSPETKVSLISTLAKATGVSGMIGGQVIDIANEVRDDVTLEELLYMYSCKTGALIRCACQMGCIVAGNNSQQQANALKYGESIGLAFQIIDDILDITGDEKKLGKPIGSDNKNEKFTSVTAMGMDKAREKAENLSKVAIETLGDFEDSDFLIDFTKQLLSREY